MPKSIIEIKGFKLHVNENQDLISQLYKSKYNMIENS